MMELRCAHDSPLLSQPFPSSPSALLPPFFDIVRMAPTLLNGREPSPITVRAYCLHVCGCVVVRRWVHLPGPVAIIPTHSHPVDISPLDLCFFHPPFLAPCDRLPVYFPPFGGSCGNTVRVSWSIFLLVLCVKCHLPTAFPASLSLPSMKYLVVPLPLFVACASSMIVSPTER